MVAKLLGIGLHQSMDFEESMKIKLLNAASLLFILTSYVFIFKHLFITQKYEVALAHFAISSVIPLIYILQYKQKYIAAKVVFFTLLHLIIFGASMFLVLGYGVENFYIVNIILVLILIKESLWVYVLMAFNAFLYISPQLFFRPYPATNYSFFTSLVVIFGIILAVWFFILIRNQFEEQLRIQNGHLEKLNEEKNDLMSIVAHDLKSPLAQIQGLINILKIDSGKLSSEQLQLIEKIKGVTDHQHKQITGFLDAKSFESSFEETVFEKVLVKRILETVLDEMLAQAIAKGIGLTYIKNAERKLAINGRNDWLFKVISNLVSNAIKFSSSGSEIFIEVKSSDNQVIIIVKDEGQGFNKNEINEIFKKNKVLSATPTANESSSGVGLYIVKKYVDQMHGSVTVESEEGIGTTFFVSLPRIS